MTSNYRDQRRLGSINIHRDRQAGAAFLRFILALGMLAAFVAQKIRIPDIAVFLVAGILIGPHSLRLIDIKPGSALNQIILLFGASYILFDGGASLRLHRHDRRAHHPRDHREAAIFPADGLTSLTAIAM